MKTKEIIEEIKDIIVKLRAEAIDHTDDWKKYPHKLSLKKITERINKLWPVLKELEQLTTQEDYEKLVREKGYKTQQEFEAAVEHIKAEYRGLVDPKTYRVDWINPDDLESEAIKRGMYSTEDYKKALENQKPNGLPNNWEQQIADKNKYLQERDERPNITIETWNNYKNRPTLDQYESRPNVTVENYNHLLSNQKPADYDAIKNELNKWKDGLGGKTLEQVQTDLNKITELEKRPTLGQLSELTEKNTQLQQQVSDLQQQLENKPELPSPRADTESKAKKIIQTELDKFSNIKIEEIGDEEFLSLLNKFKTMKNWILTGNDEESEAAINKQSELKKITSELSLENCRRIWKHKIDYALKDEYEYEEDEIGEQEEHLERIVLKNTDLTMVEYIDYEITLKKKTSKKELDKFGYKVVEDIYKQRPKHKYIIDLINEGKEAIKHKNVDLANEVLDDLKFLEKKEKQVFFSKIVEINRLKKEMRPLIQSQQAQIVQTGK